MDNKANEIMEATGNVKISDEVIATITHVAVSEIKGVSGMSGSFAGDIAQMLGKKNMTKGVKVDLKENSVTLDLNVIIEYGVKIPEVAWEIQEAVKKAIESMTGLDVEKVNIHVVGIDIPKIEEKSTDSDENISE